jgi:sulfatase modifying factor 1
MKHPIRFTFGLAVLASVSLVTPARAVTIDYVAVGNAGNAADTRVMIDSTTGYGAVSYAYQIARNETTISQYAEFLNAVAKTDTYALYNPGMTTSYINGISRGGVSGAYEYTVNPGSGNKPITYVSWFDAARFCNWMQNDQPVGLQTVGTTEGGTYTLNGATSGVSVSKNVGATVWIPSEDEWYKAAYYDPNKGGAGVGGYWLYPTQSDTMTTNDIGVVGAANYRDANGYAVYTGGSSLAITDVGAYGANSDSAYGTNDQAGNVWEWNDAVIGSSRGVRGGSYNYEASGLASSYRNVSVVPSFEFDVGGFRVASVIPEPSCWVLAILASGMMLIRRKR